MRLSFLGILILSLLSCRDNNNKTKKIITDTKNYKADSIQLSYYKCDYLRNKYDTILYSGDKRTVTEVWGVDRKDISEFPIVNTIKLDSSLLIRKAELHLKKRFPTMELQFSSFNIKLIDELDSLNTKNKFAEISFLYDKRGYYQVVPVLLDSRIVLSNNE